MVGIGGVGMSGIAEVLVTLGYDVSGSDMTESPALDRLRAVGAHVMVGHDAGHVMVGHDADHVERPDMVVVSAAVPGDNPEVTEAARLAIPIVSRGAMLAELTGRRRAIAVVGSHGKTTTTSMVAIVLEACGVDPTAIIGGRVSAFGSNARLGRGPFIVVEADESDRSFLRLSPEIAVLTNIDDEHLDAYAGMADLEQAFAAFASRVPPHGCLVACADDERLRRLTRDATRPVLTYAIDEPTASVRAHDVALGATGSRCRVTVTTDNAPDDFELDLRIPGRHNVLNALAAVAVGTQIGVAPLVMSDALAGFAGADRRFEVRGEVDGIRVIDDYGHHPTEITAVLETARLGAPRRVVVVFQPHRYTRTHRLLDRFGPALALADMLILTDVFAAGEAPLPGATAEAIAAEVAATSPMPIRRVASLDEAVETVMSVARRGDVIVTLGAGSVGRIAPRIVELLKGRES